MITHCQYCGCYVAKVSFCSPFCQRRFEIKARIIAGPNVLELWVLGKRRQVALEKIEDLVDDKRYEFECPNTCGGNPDATCTHCVNIGFEEIEEIVEGYRERLMESLGIETKWLGN